MALSITIIGNFTWIEYFPQSKTKAAAAATVVAAAVPTTIIIKKMIHLIKQIRSKKNLPLNTFRNNSKVG